MNNSILIFDFDGTIADTHSYIITISNRLSREFNYNTIRMDEVERLKDKTSQELIRHLKVPILKIPAIVARGKKEFHQNISHIKPIDGLKDVLYQLKELNTTLGILSSNTLENIMKFLSNHDLDIFDFIDTTHKIWSKDSSLRNLMDKNGFSKEDVIYVGDEIRDITATRKLGIKVAAVAWGYNSARVLEKYHPDFIIYKPQELLKLPPHLSPSNQ